MDRIASESRLDYLSREDSKLYVDVRHSDDPKDQIIKRLLERIADASWQAHCAERY